MKRAKRMIFVGIAFVLFCMATSPAIFVANILMISYFGNVFAPVMVMGEAVFGLLFGYMAAPFIFLYITED